MESKLALMDTFLYRCFLHTFHFIFTHTVVDLMTPLPLIVSETEAKIDEHEIMQVINSTAQI